MARFEQIYSDGSTTTVSFDKTPWVAVRCMSCGSTFTSTKCQQCGVNVPVTAFEKSGLWAKLS